MSKPFAGPQKDKTRINGAIRASELRVVTEDGETLGVLSLLEALRAAEERQLDLIEISPNAVPPVAKIMDYGKYRYQTGRKAREVKAKSHVTETKNVQVKIGTGDHDQQLKAKRAAEWLSEGHRVKVDLFLWGRYKYMEEAFLKERLERFLKIIPADYKLAEPIKKGPKGLTTTIERTQGGSKVALGPQIKTTTGNPVHKATTSPQKTRKKSLEDLLESGMI